MPRGLLGQQGLHLVQLMPRITTFSHMNLYIEINSCKMFAGNDKNVVRQEENQKKKVKMKN